MDMQRKVVTVTGWLVVAQPLAHILGTFFDMAPGSTEFDEVGESACACCVPYVCCTAIGVIKCTPCPPAPQYCRPLT
jgi:hypothetical protein